MLKEKSIKEFTELIASKSPYPGGGGCSSLVGAIGIALGDMVGEFTLGKKKYAEYEEDIRRLMERAQKIREELLELVEEDARMFEPLSKAYAIPKDDPSHDEILEKCLRDAVEPPLKTFDLCIESIDIFDELLVKGSKLMLSDVATGVIHIWGAMYGAACNVKVNTSLMKDREYAEKINRHVDSVMNLRWKDCERIFEEVYKTY